MEPYHLPTASPESVGIPSRAIGAFLDAIEGTDVMMHSFLLLRHGKLVSEAYWKPYARDVKHLMYSITKSFTSTAIGFLADEGKLTLDDFICDYFPEKLPAGGVHPYTKLMTIRNLLTMSTVHEKTAWKAVPSNDWVGAFFTLAPSHIPGTVFTYDTGATHTLAALVKKLSGQNLLEYLRPRLLDPLGFAPDTYCWLDPMGIAQGGSGLHCLPIELMKFGLCYMQGGVFNGKQVIPAWYAKEATSRQVDNTLSAMRLEGQQGYGYFFWRTRHNGFACYGAGGQFVFCLPEQDLVLVTTANAQRYANDHQRIFDVFWDTIYPALGDAALPADPAGEAELAARISSLSLPLAQGELTSPNQAAYFNRDYQMEQNDMGIRACRLEQTATGGVFRFEMEGGWQSLPFAFGRMEEGVFPVRCKPCVTSAAWQDERTLMITSHLLDDVVATAALSLVFDAGQQGSITFFGREYGETGVRQLRGYVSGALVGYASSVLSASAK